MVLGRRDNFAWITGGRAIEVPWYGSAEKCIEELASGKTFVSDTGIAGCANVQKLYEEAGYPDEWKKHHQGGQEEMWKHHMM